VRTGMVLEADPPAAIRGSVLATEAFREGTVLLAVPAVLSADRLREMWA
jgi:hypothetical protein